MASKERCPLERVGEFRDRSRSPRVHEQRDDCEVSGNDGVPVKVPAELALKVGTMVSLALLSAQLKMAGLVLQGRVERLMESGQSGLNELWDPSLEAAESAESTTGSGN